MVKSSGTKVIKIGGSLLLNSEDFQEISHQLMEEISHDNSILVVISAMKGVTDMLASISEKGFSDLQDILSGVFAKYPEELSNIAEIGILSQLFSEEAGSHSNKKAFTDSLVTLGERLSAVSLAMVLLDSGIQANILDPCHIISVSGDGTTINTKESSEFFNNLKSRIGIGNISIIPGFYGITSTGEIRTLGRGGSDFTAGVMAYLSDASELEFWKDVGAVFTGDPGLVENPRPILQISLDMLKGITNAGSRILHPLSLDLIDTEKCSVTIRGVRGSLHGKTELVSRDTDCFSIIVSNKMPLSIPGSLFYENAPGTSSVTIVADGRPEYRRRILARLQSVLELWGRNNQSSFQTSETISTIVAPQDQCVDLARIIHKELVYGEFQ